MKYLLVSAVLMVTAISLFSFRQESFDLKSSITRGNDLYITQCQSCHLVDGAGLEDVYPPLAKSDYLMADKIRSVKVVMYGAYEEMKVNGKVYDAEMADLELTDQQVSDVLNFVRNSFGNKGEPVLPQEVKALRKK